MICDIRIYFFPNVLRELLCRHNYAACLPSVTHFISCHGLVVVVEPGREFRSYFKNTVNTNELATHFPPPTCLLLCSARVALDFTVLCSSKKYLFSSDPSDNLRAKKIHSTLLSCSMIDYCF